MMKRRIHIVTLVMTVVLTAICGNATALRTVKSPQVDYNPFWAQIKEIRFYKDSTVCNVDIKHYPHYWVSVSKGMALVNPSTQKKYMLIKCVGMPVNEKVYMPESGHIPCRLVFAPLDKGVETLSMIDPESRLDENLYGIHLSAVRREKKKTANGKVNPDMMTADYYLSLPANKEPWHLRKNPEWKYRKGSFAIVRGKLLHYVPDLGVKTVMIFINDFTSDLHNNYVANINADGTYQIKLPISHPVVATFLYPYDKIYLEPGDTLDMCTSVETRLYGKGYRSYHSNGESGMINALHDTIMRKYGIKPDSFTSPDAAKLGKDSILSTLDNYIKNFLGTMDESKLNNTPLTPNMKDYMVMTAQAEISDDIEEFRISVENSFAYNRNGNKIQKEDISPANRYVLQEYDKRYKSLFVDKQQIFDNPRMISSFASYVFLLNNPIFGKYDSACTHLLYREPGNNATSAVNLIKSINDYNMEHYGIGQCFVSELTLNENLTVEMHCLQRDNSTDTRNFTDFHLEKLTDEIAEILPTMKNEMLRKNIMREYRNTIRMVDTSKKLYELNDEQQAILKKIIGEYKGKVTFLSFYSTDYLKRQMKDDDIKYINEMKDKNVQFLFVNLFHHQTDESEAEWMGKKNVHARYLPLNNDETNHIKNIFNAYGLSNIIILDKEGNVIFNNGANSFYINKDLINVYAEKE